MKQWERKLSARRRLMPTMWATLPCRLPSLLGWKWAVSVGHIEKASKMGIRHKEQTLQARVSHL